jgi:hypothetical protein
MNRLLKLLAGLGIAAFACPSAALAYENQMTPLGLHITVSAVGLIFAVVLLVQALELRKVTLGGAIAERLHLVVLAIICLAASALAKWTTNFVSGVTFEQTELVSEMFVALAMALIAGYFFSVRTAMQSYISAAKHADTGSSAGESAADAGADSRG